MAAAKSRIEKADMGVSRPAPAGVDTVWGLMKLNY
jgi:hypothetical protein